ncbi:hypothetical protein EHP00_189 [Ecytonucleospora hepatopenaei]|uniref:Uncharacterized protein n=1 Tax=Ecytonucleospora hepatopenaei TaxID=646526 RepID=A0A1W0E6E8_9MICR|nr:hypothetical protein EHP00_189 [Ecytonucleospora hepatopenaei]
MFSINFKEKFTNLSINNILKYIEGSGIDYFLYKDLARLFTCNLDDVSERFKQKLASYFVNFSENPILVLEVKDLIKNNENLHKIYANYFINKEGVDDMFNVEKSKSEFCWEEYERICEDNTRRIKPKNYDKNAKRKNNSNRKNAKKNAMQNHKDKVFLKKQKKAEFSKTEHLFKKFSTF